MPDTEEQRRAAAGVVTPDAAGGPDRRRQAAGVYSFGEDDAGPPGTEAEGQNNRMGISLGIGF